MAKEFFKNFPEIKYKLDDGRVIFIKDFFRKSKIEQQAVESIVDYTFYEIQNGERPDIVATKLYGNPDLHWTFFLVNELENYYDWHMDQETFRKYLDKKYHGQYLVFDQSTDVVSSTQKFLLGEKITSISGEGRIIEVDPTHKRIGVDVTKPFVANENVSTASRGTNQVIDGVDTFIPTITKMPAQIKNRIDGTYEYKKGNIRRNSTATGFSEVTFLDHELEENEKKRKIKVIRPELIDGIVRRFEKIMLS